MPFKTLKELDPTEGTVTLLSSSAGQQHLARSDIVLVPQPSSDPDDPLRWPAWRKHMVFASICAFAALNNFSGTVLSDSFFTIAQNFDITLGKASGLISWVILTLGLSNFFWVPCAIYFGKRPVFIVACSITVVAALWAALASGFNSLLAACIFGAFGGGASEALGAAIINDIYFLHERGSKMAYYIISIAWGSSIGPLCGGYLIERKGWRWGKWLSLILLALNLIMILFFAPETRFNRSPNVLVANMPSDTGSANSTEKGDDHIEHLDSPRRQTFPRETTGTKSQLQLLNPWSGINTRESFWKLMVRPIPLFAYPACAFATITYSITLAPTVMVNVLSSIILIPPPYTFSVGAVGLINIPGMIGQLVGAIIGGKVIDIWSRRKARQNNGIFVPETRLQPLLIPTCLVFAGTMLFGFAVQEQMHWAVIFVAYGLISTGLTGSASITMTYVSDSYFPVAAECLEVINGLKNVVAFGFIRSTVTWTEHEGYRKAFGELSGIFGALMAFGIPLYFFGAQIRHYTSTKWRLISWKLD